MKPFILVLSCLLVLLPGLTIGQTVVGTEITDAKNEAVSLQVDARCLQHFEESFTKPMNVRWRPTADGYGVNFSQHGINYDTRYNRRGRWTGTIQYIPVELLDKHVAAAVKRVYPRYDIFFAQKLSVPRGSIYVIKVERGNEWKLLHVVHRSVTVVGEYVKN